MKIIIKLLVKFIMFVGLCFNAYAQPFQFKISKNYCILNFLETATQQSRTSSDLYEFITTHTKNDSSLKAICKQYSSLQLHPQYKLDGFPAKRPSDNNIYNLIVTASINSSTIKEFEQSIIGYLPNSDLIKLISLMQRAEPIYDRLIWNENKRKLYEQVSALEKYSLFFSSTLLAAQQFYQTSWPVNTPFIVSLFPIPGRGGMTATPHVNNLCVGVLTDTTDYPLKASVILHEMCHIFYKEQPKELQNRLEDYFLRNKSIYSLYAYNFIDEALATAIGNGWAFKKINGRLKEGVWYENKYISEFAKEIYPAVVEYFDNNKPIDSLFVTKSIGLFENRLPQATHDYNALLFPNVSIYTANEQDSQQLFIKLYSKFQLYNVAINGFSYKGTLEKLMTEQGTQLVILSGTDNKYLDNVKSAFPQLNDVALRPNSILSFFDSKQRPIIILISDELTTLDLLISEMKKKPVFDTNKIIQN